MRLDARAFTRQHLKRIYINETGISTAFGTNKRAHRVIIVYLESRTMNTGILSVAFSAKATSIFGQSSAGAN